MRQLTFGAVAACVSVAALEGMLDVALALLDEAAAV